MNDRRLHDFSTRLNKALDAAGFPPKGEGRQVELGKRMGVSQKGARKWVEAEGMPSTRRLEELATVARTTVGYLMGLEPETFGHNSALTKISGANTQPGPRITGRVPLISWVQAGSMTEATDLLAPGVADDWIPTTAPINRHTYALQVRGDSMEPDIPDGSVVIVEPDMDPLPGDYVIAGNGDAEATLKQLIRDGGEWFLKPSNPRYPVRPLGDGKVVGVVRSLERRFR